jgi:hypothetical protein
MKHARWRNAQSGKSPSLVPHFTREELSMDFAALLGPDDCLVAAQVGR